MKVFLTILFLFFLVGCPSSNNPQSHSNASKAQSLSLSKIERIKGGSTLSFLITYKDGRKGIFKCEQEKSSVTKPSYEIAAYVVSELIGLGKVPYTWYQDFDQSSFLDLAKQSSVTKNLLSKRGHELRVSDDKLKGAVLTYIPQLHYPKLDSSGIDSKSGRAKWRHYLKAATPIPSDKRDLLKQISDTIVFDFVIGNQDRWSGGNILATKKGEKYNLVLIDNAMSFGQTKEGHGVAKKSFLELQSFSKSLIDSLKRLSQSKLDSALAKHRGAYDVLVDKVRREAVVSRAAYVVKRVENMKEKRFF